MKNPRRIFLALAAIALLAGCAPAHQSIVVGSKNFTEQAVLGEILAQHIEKRTGLAVERRFYLAGSYICHQAMLAGRMDLYPEYTGTALTAILKQKLSGSSSEVYQRVKDEYHQRFAIEVAPPLGFNNSFALVIRGDDARRLKMRTISDLEKVAPKWRMGVGYEFLERPDGFAGLAKTYGLHFAEPPRVMDLGLLYRALDEKQVDVVVGSGTDGLIQARGLVALEDDRHYFPPYDAVPVVREQTLARYPALREALSELGGKISEEDMRRLNYAVDGEHRDVKQLAAEFLRKKGL
ncbi:MAG TPA: glycine betaine ABC transporter substrate-binding protein [Candidatus Angelobacter sp.]|nr:glycine betaine ABC transporter substrate-binding protein [Candidatus Angelobacter sp.]